MKTTMMYKKVICSVVSGIAVAAWADGGRPLEPTATQPSYPQQRTGNSGVNNDANLNDRPANQSGSMQTPMFSVLTAQQFVNDAASGGMKEVALSRLALDQSQNDEVKTFAAKMVTDHSQANHKLAQIAAQEGLNCPATNTFTANDPNWRNPLVVDSSTIKGQGAYLLTTNGPDVASYQAVQRLKGLSGHEFDLAYAKDMVADHILTVNEFEAASRNLSDPALRKFASDTLPTLREHSQMAQKLENQLEGQTADNDSPKPIAPETATAGGL